VVPDNAPVQRESDIVREIFQAGELQSLLKDKGVPVKEAAQA
jgi:hypothetical protein